MPKVERSLADISKKGRYDLTHCQRNKELYPLRDEVDPKDEEALKVAVKKHVFGDEKMTNLSEVLDKFEHTQQLLSSAEIVERISFEAFRGCSFTQCNHLGTTVFLGVHTARSPEFDSPVDS